MGNGKSRSGQNVGSQFLPEEQAEMDRLFDALSSEKSSPNTSPRSFSLKALKARITVINQLMFSPEQASANYGPRAKIDSPFLWLSIREVYGNTEKCIFSKGSVVPIFCCVGYCCLCCNYPALPLYRDVLGAFLN